MTGRRISIIVLSISALLVANFFVVSFLMGFSASLGSYDLAGVLAVVAGAIFIAPFNFVLFERLVEYAGGGDS